MLEINRITSIFIVVFCAFSEYCEGNNSQEKKQSYIKSFVSFVKGYKKNAGFLGGSLGKEEET